eukprot:5482799-Alexandrium_andersonii.AAC.1
MRKSCSCFSGHYQAETHPALHSYLGWIELVRRQGGCTRSPPCTNALPSSALRTLRAASAWQGSRRCGVRRRGGR